jgi:DNA-3-methyladenine glycosylase I
MDTIRCSWCEGDSLMQKYHDEEWGFPLHDERKHFEFLLLEFFQAGLSWMTILKKRENFRKAFDGFDPLKVSRYGDDERARLLSDAGIIRNRLKIEAAINNAQQFIEIGSEFGSFDSYIWSFSGGKPVNNRFTEMKDIPVSTPLSDTVSKDMKNRGFKFVGTTTIYAHLQAIGVVNDHIVECFRYEECGESK